MGCCESNADEKRRNKQPDSKIESLPLANDNANVNYAAVEHNK